MPAGANRARHVVLLPLGGTFTGECVVACRLGLAGVAAEAIGAHTLPLTVARDIGRDIGLDTFAAFTASGIAVGRNQALLRDALRDADDGCERDEAAAPRRLFCV